jgi:hypothetical protein
MLSDDQRRALRSLAEMMIPASTESGVPSAADDAIFADILRSFGRDEHHVMTVLRELEGFADLDPSARQAKVAQLREHLSDSLKGLSSVVLQCYYRDDRVMRSLGMEPRPPFPKGHEVEQGDWSLLDPVRKRQRFIARCLDISLNHH